MAGPSGRDGGRTDVPGCFFAVRTGDDARRRRRVAARRARAPRASTRGMASIPGGSRTLRTSRTRRRRTSPPATERRARGSADFRREGGGDQRIFRIRNDGTRRGARRGGRARDAHHVDHVVHDIAATRGVDPHVGPRRERGRHLARRCNATAAVVFETRVNELSSARERVPSHHCTGTKKRNSFEALPRSEPRGACRRPSITEHPSPTRARISFPLRLKLSDPARASGSARAVSSRGRRTADSY